METYSFIQITNKPICRGEFEENSWETMDKFIKTETGNRGQRDRKADIQTEKHTDR